MQQRFRAHAKIHLAAAAVYQKAHADYLAAVLPHHVHDFLDAAAGGNNIFHYQHPGAFRNLEAAFQGHLAVFPFRKDSPGV